MFLRGISVVISFSLGAVMQAQADVSAYEKVSGEPSLSVVSTSSLQSANNELDSSVSDLEESFDELSLTVLDLQDSSSSSSSSGEIGSWFFADFSSSRDYNYYIDVYSSDTDMVYETTGSNEDIYDDQVADLIADFTCVVGLAGYVEVPVQATDYVYDGYFYVTCE